MPNETPSSAPEQDKPKRLSLSQIVEMLLTRSAERSSVGLTRNSKGDTQIEVRVSTGADGEAATLEDAEAKAVAVYDRLREMYAPAAAREDATVSLTRNAKGETQVSIEVGTSDGGVASTDEALQKAQSAYDTVRANYPMLSGFTAAPGSVKARDDA